MSADAVRITRLAVRGGRIVCDVAIAHDAPRESTPQLAAYLAAQLPSLPDHACVNEHGTTFGTVMSATPLPHVLEHLVIDLQVRSEDRLAHAASEAKCAAAGANEPASTYVGTSEWIDEAAGTACVEVSFADDLVALRAFRDAAAILNDALRATGLQRADATTINEA